MNNYQINEIKNYLNNNKHTIFIIKSNIVLTNFLDFILKEWSNALLIDFSKRGENGRPNGFEGKGNINIEQITQSEKVITKAIGDIDKESSLYAYSIICGQKTSIYITDENIPNNDFFYDNPSWDNLYPILVIELNDDSINTYELKK